MKRFISLIFILVGVSVLTCWLALRQSQVSELPPVKAIWVTRFDYDSPEDVRSIVRNLSDAGFSDIFFQVRGNGTAYYRSGLEPWAFELSGGVLEALGTDPGWDPLQLAAEYAQLNGVRLHAYMNVLPGWKGLSDPPAASGQLWGERPEWFMVDSLGDKMRPTSGWYAFLNPVLPDVQEYLGQIAAELSRYNIAGVHLDYIRYPHDYRLVAGQIYPDASKEELGRRSEFSYDSVSQALLYSTYGWDVNKKQIADFRCDSVTRVVQEISRSMQRVKPDGCLLSASVMGNPVEGRAHAFQDSGRWVRESLVDWVVQMNYGTTSFERYMGAMKRAAGRRGFKRSVVMGIYCKNRAEDVVKQLALVRDSKCRGFSLFSYTYLFDEQHQVTKKGRIVLEAIRP